MAPCCTHVDPARSSPSHNRKAHSTTSILPIIRIVHVNAPKLVCTDAANFRALVQEMTGNIDMDSSKSSTLHADLAASDKTDCGTLTAGPSESVCRKMRSRRRYRRTAGSSNVAQNRHQRAVASLSTGQKEMAIDENVDSSIESPAMSTASSCEGLFTEDTGFHSDSVNGFFADDDDDDDDDDGDDKEMNTDTYGYFPSTTNYYGNVARPMRWGPASDEDALPGGFDYISF